MCFLRLPSSTRWLELRKMVGYEPINWEGWLEDVTLFPTSEPNDILNFNEILDNKANNEVSLDTGLPDLDWLDEKLDLSIFDSPPTEEEVSLLKDAANLLLNPEASNLEPCYLSSDIYKNEIIDILDPDILNINDKFASGISYGIPSSNYEAISEAGSPASCGGESTHLTSSEFAASPREIASGSPAGQVVPEEFFQFPITMSYCSTSKNHLAADNIYQSSNSSTEIETLHTDEFRKVSFCSTPGEQLPSDVFSSFGNEVEVPSISDEYCPSPSEASSSSSAVSVICDVSPDDVLSPRKTLNANTVSNTVKERQYVQGEKGTTKNRTLPKNSFHPYAKGSSRRSNKNDRKKVQNKEAAARYRIKKRVEEQEIMREVDHLESHQDELQQKHDSLLGEIKYLKSLMCEMLQRKGLL